MPNSESAAGGGKQRCGNPEVPDAALPHGTEVPCIRRSKLAGNFSGLAIYRRRFDKMLGYISSLIGAAHDFHEWASDAPMAVRNRVGRMV